MDEKLISVVVPVYNGALTLEKCIQSIENQTYKNIEIIISDDGSEDNSLQIAENLAKLYKNISVLKNTHGGVSAARNSGLSVAKGELITFIDCDDEIKEDMLFTMEQNITNKGAQMAVVGIERITNNERFFEPYSKEKVVFIDNAAKLYLKPMYFNSCSNKLYITDIIRKNSITFDGSVYIGEDFMFNTQYARFASKIAVISEPMYIYNMSGGTLKPSDNKRRFDIIAGMYKAITPLFANDDELFQCIKRKIYDEYLLAIRLYCMSDAPFKEKLSTVRSVMSSDVFIKVKKSHKNIAGKYKYAIATGSPFFICLYFSLTRAVHK